MLLLSGGYWKMLSIMLKNGGGTLVEKGLAVVFGILLIWGWASFLKS